MALNASLALPIQVTSPVDIGRLQREIEAIDSVLSQAALRKTTEVKMGKTTSLMDATVQLNKLSLIDPSHRKDLSSFLAQLKSKAPVLHISFSADPAASFVEKLVTWLRREIDPFVLVTVGLQPNIGAGCVVRSTNKYFDLSLRQDFASKRDLLMENLGPAIIGISEIAGVPSAAAVAAAVLTEEQTESVRNSEVHVEPIPEESIPAVSVQEPEPLSHQQTQAVTLDQTKTIEFPKELSAIGATGATGANQ